MQATLLPKLEYDGIVSSMRLQNTINLDHHTSPSLEETGSVL